jgi:putative membrane protein
MFKLILINSIAVFLTAALLKGVQIKSFATAIGVSILLAILNTLVKPVLVILTLPVTILTLGLFIIVINAFILVLVDKLVEGLKIDSFGWAVLMSIVMGLINSLLFWMF